MKKRQIILLLGQQGSGKTTLAKNIIDGYKRVVVLDSMYEYSGVIFENFLDVIDYTISRELQKTENSFKIVCRFISDTAIEFLFKYIWNVPDILFVVEESEIYLNPRSMNDDFLRLIRYGRHQNISLLCIARRIPEISIDFRSQCTSIITYRQTEPNDVQKLIDYGFTNEQIESIKNELHTYTFIGEELECLKQN